ncbi:MAG: 4-oxalocrotonate tautomerase [Rhodospirillales bacterium]|nr:4-oxalocrotonate tautomerase [Rhodospirillales bacterium]MBT4041479.1 4-oxalocrotonate tautomerase [Rhodospirillales bacterium]MBT4626893.1 4-oxalocrotonate tautomerase [Rhodospirillales bacterium]MBT5350477.1 4-oxalocrotonate tautomerase [Rhodospirillales bacterium]MBT5519642.1 4-oxalocrotonate tautomerase [Rhodospirillales bacterium]
MPSIHVEMLTGKTRDQKRALVKELTEGYVRAVGGKPDGIYIFINEFEKEDVGIGGMNAIDKYPD